MKALIILIFLVSCGLKPDLVRPTDLISKNLVNGDEYLLAVTSEVSNNVSGAIPLPVIFAGGGRVSFDYDREGLTAYQLTETNQKDGVSEKIPLFRIPGEHIEYRCRTRKWGKCVEEERDEEMHWSHRSLFLPRYEKARILSDYDILFGDMKECLGEKSSNLVSYNMDNDAITVVVKLAFPILSKMECSYIEGYENIVAKSGNTGVFTVTNKYSFKKAALLASKEYFPLEYPKEQQAIFGVFPTTHNKTDKNYDEKAKDYYIHRWAPGSNIIYYLTGVFNEDTPFAKKLIAAAKEIESNMNRGFKEEGIPLTVEFRVGDYSFGDVNQNVIYLDKSRASSSVVGYGPTATDSTGEIVNAQVYLSWTSFLSMAERAYISIRQNYLKETDTTDVTSEMFGVKIFKKDEEATGLLNFNPSERNALAEYSSNPKQEEDNATSIILKSSLEKLEIEGVTTQNFNLTQKMLNTNIYLTIPFSNSSLENKDITLTKFADDKNNPALMSFEKINQSKNRFRNMGYDVDLPMANVSKVTASKYVSKVGFLEKRWNELTNEERDKFYQDVVPRLMQETLIHEVGHTLGLRHNFAASFDKTNFYSDAESKELGYDHVPQASSMMDYLFSNLNSLIHFGKYDLAVLKYMYRDYSITEEGLKNLEAVANDQIYEQNLIDKEKDLFIEVEKIEKDENVNLTPFKNAFMVERKMGIIKTILEHDEALKTDFLLKEKEIISLKAIKAERDEFLKTKETAELLLRKREEEESLQFKKMMTKFNPVLSQDKKNKREESKLEELLPFVYSTPEASARPLNILKTVLPITMSKSELVLYTGWLKQEDESRKKNLSDLSRDSFSWTDSLINKRIDTIAKDLVKLRAEINEMKHLVYIVKRLEPKVMAVLDHKYSSNLYNFAYCSDEDVNNSMRQYYCARHDEGTDVLSISQNYIDRYKNLVEMLNFRDRRRTPINGALFEFINLNSKSEVLLSIRDLYLKTEDQSAKSLIINFFNEILSMPERTCVILDSENKEVSKILVDIYMELPSHFRERIPYSCFDLEVTSLLDETGKKVVGEYGEYLNDIDWYYPVDTIRNNVEQAYYSTKGVYGRWRDKVMAASIITEYDERGVSLVEKLPEIKHTYDTTLKLLATNNQFIPIAMPLYNKRTGNLIKDQNGEIRGSLHLQTIVDNIIFTPPRGYGFSPFQFSVDVSSGGMMLYHYYLAHLDIMASRKFSVDSFGKSINKYTVLDDVKRYSTVDYSKEGIFIYEDDESVYTPYFGENAAPILKLIFAYRTAERVFKTMDKIEILRIMELAGRDERLHKEKYALFYSLYDIDPNIFVLAMISDDLLSSTVWGNLGMIAAYFIPLERAR